MFALSFAFNHIRSQSLNQENFSETYIVGTGIRDFTRLLNGQLPHGLGTYGYANYRNPIDTTKNESENNIINGVHLPLKTRVITIKHSQSEKSFVYVLLDMAFASDNIRKGIVKEMQKHDASFESAALMITATHTHSAPAGFSDYIGYELAAPGYRPEFVKTVVTRTCEAILDAWSNESSMNLVFSESEVPDSIPIAFSRGALPAYNSNPEVNGYFTPENNYLATDRIWQLIHFEKSGQIHSLLNFFGAHPNRLGPDIISSDTRGAASQYAEEVLPENGLALFAQNAPGDIDDEGSYHRKVSPEKQMCSQPLLQMAGCKWEVAQYEANRQGDGGREIT